MGIEKILPFCLMVSLYVFLIAVVVCIIRLARRKNDKNNK